MYLRFISFAQSAFGTSQTLAMKNIKLDSQLQIQKSVNEKNPLLVETVLIDQEFLRMLGRKHLMSERR